MNHVQSIHKISRIQDSCVIYSRHWTSSFGPESSSCSAHYDGSGDLLITTIDSGGLIRELLDADLVSVNYRVEAIHIPDFMSRVNQIRWSFGGFLAKFWPKKYLLPALSEFSEVSERLRLALIDLIEPYRVR